MRAAVIAAVLTASLHLCVRSATRRQAATRGFFDAMSARQRRKAFSLAAARYSSLCPLRESAIVLKCA